MIKKIATAAVIWHEDKVLIAQRAKDEFWEFPGGKIDPGETPQECIVREIREELDIDIRLGAQLETVEGYYRFQNMILYGFHAVCINPSQLKLNVHLAYKWVDVKELSYYSIVEEDQELIIQIQNDERNWKFRDIN